jgi:hypothetical protein
VVNAAAPDIVSLAHIAQHLAHNHGVEIARRALHRHPTIEIDL